MINRIFTIVLLAFLVVGCDQKQDSKEILFVCTHGAARSPIAAAYFNKIAKEKELNYHAVFRGTDPDKELTAGTIEGLEKDNFKTLNWKPSKVSDMDIEKAEKIVTFDCSLPMTKSDQKDIIQWNGTPSISKDYEKARNAIEERVKTLVETLGEK